MNDEQLHQEIRRTDKLLHILKLMHRRSTKINELKASVKAQTESKSGPLYYWEDVRERTQRKIEICKAFHKMLSNYYAQISSRNA